MRAFAWCLVLTTAGCTVPSLDSLGVARCDLDAGLGCVAGQRCLDGVCRPESFSCSPDASRACNQGLGQCPAGTQGCDQAGQWSACSTDDAGYAATEVLCDGVDNDCDGLLDVSSPTDLQAGGSGLSMARLPDAGVALSVISQGSGVLRLLADDLTLLKQSSFAASNTPAVATRGSGLAMTWVESNNQVRWSALSASGQGLFTVDVPTSGASKYHPDVAVSADGAAVMVGWVEQTRLTARLFAGDGGLASAELVRAGPTGTTQDEGQFAALGSGWVSATRNRVTAYAPPQALWLDFYTDRGNDAGELVRAMPDGGVLSSFALAATGPDSAVVFWVEVAPGQWGLYQQALPGGAAVQLLSGIGNPPLELSLDRASGAALTFRQRQPDGRSVLMVMRPPGAPRVVLEANLREPVVVGTTPGVVALAYSDLDAGPALFVVNACLP